MHVKLGTTNPWVALSTWASCIGIGTSSCLLPEVKITSLLFYLNALKCPGAIHTDSWNPRESLLVKGPLTCNQVINVVSVNRSNVVEAQLLKQGAAAATDHTTGILINLAGGNLHTEQRWHNLTFAPAAN